MPHATYPTEYDLIAYLEGAGVIDASPGTAAPGVLAASGRPFAALGLGAKVAAARTLFEVKAGRTFLAAPATRHFDPPHGPRGVLDLSADLCSDPAGAIAVTLNGCPQTPAVDYWLGPDNADADGVPWGWVEFPRLSLARAPLPRRSVAVSGPWGYSLAVPDDVWDAVLQKAAALCVPQIAVQISNGLYRIDDVYFQGSNASPLSAERAMWEAGFESTAEGRKRVSGYF